MSSTIVTPTSYVATNRSVTRVQGDSKPSYKKEIENLKNRKFSRNDQITNLILEKFRLLLGTTTQYRF